MSIIKKLNLSALVLFFSIQALAISKPMPVAVSIAPQKYFVEKIAGDLVDVTVVVPKGFEPEDYEPNPKQLKQLSNVNAYFSIDVPFETSWLSKFQSVNPKMKVIPTHAGIKKRKMTASSHSHRHGHHHHEIIKDPHIWLSPKLAKVQVKHILDALIKMDPHNKKRYQKNYKKLLQEINETDQFILALSKKSKTPPSQPFFILHPFLGYFAQDYGLKQIPIEAEGKTPTLKQLNKIVAQAKKYKVKTIFLSPEYSPKVAQVVADAIDGKLYSLDPLEENWPENLKKIAIAVFKSSPIATEHARPTHSN